MVLILESEGTIWLIEQPLLLKQFEDKMTISCTFCGRNKTLVFSTKIAKVPISITGVKSEKIQKWCKTKTWHWRRQFSSFWGSHNHTIHTIIFGDKIESSFVGHYHYIALFAYLPLFLNTSFWFFWNPPPPFSHNLTTGIVGVF